MNYLNYIPSRQEWNSLSRDQQIEIARQIETKLPSSFTFSKVQTFSLGNITQPIAMFLYEGKTTFSLILGDDVNLGFDSSNWQPNTDEEESWAYSVEEWGREGTLLEYINNATTMPRQVSFSPFLIETIASEVGWESLSLDNPEIQDWIKPIPNDSQQ